MNTNHLQFAINDTLGALKDKYTVDDYVFKNKTIAEKNSLFTEIDRKWFQFSAVCDSLLTADEIRNFQSVIDFAVVISLKKYVLGYALGTEVQLNATTKSLLINSLCARSSLVKKKLINICHDIGEKNLCESLHLHALLPDVDFYKTEGFKMSEEVQFACIETHNNNDDAAKFKTMIQELQVQMAEIPLLATVSKKMGKIKTAKQAERLKDNLYKAFYSKQKLTKKIVLRGIIESGIVNKEEVMTWTTKAYFTNKLGKIATEFTSKVLLTKCLLDIGGGGGGAGPRCLDDQDSRGTKRGRSDDNELSRKKGKGKQKANPVNDRRNDPYGGASAGGAGLNDYGEDSRKKGKGKQKANPDPYGGGSAGGGVIDLTFSDDSGETTETDDEFTIRHGESREEFYRRFYASNTDTEINDSN